MKKLLTIILGLSFLIMSDLYATSDHQEDHMHGGKMINHSNPNGMTNEQMSDTNNNMHNEKMTNNANQHQMSTTGEMNHEHK